MVSEKSILIAAVLVFVGFVAVSVVFEDFGVTTDDERIQDGCLRKPCWAASWAAGWAASGAASWAAAADRPCSLQVPSIV